MRVGCAEVTWGWGGDTGDGWGGDTGDGWGGGDIGRDGEEI